MRNEIKRNQKIYFYDNGIRNAVINDFRPINSRQVKGSLWENFLISERLKLNSYHKKLATSYFWRTTSQQEIDYVEVSNDEISAFEFKWSKKAKVKIPKSFETSYQTRVNLINTSNFSNFLKP